MAGQETPNPQYPVAQCGDSECPCAVASTLHVELRDANVRALIVSKNYWMDRALKAEAKLTEMRSHV